MALILELYLLLNKLPYNVKCVPNFRNLKLKDKEILTKLGLYTSTYFLMLF